MTDELYLGPGKIPPAVLHELLARFGARSRRVLLGPTPGEDAAAVLHSQPVLVVSSDPVTFPTPRPCWHAVHLNANNVATRGADPAWFTVTLLLAPADARISRLESLLAELGEACSEVGAELLGGHTEVVPGLERTMVTGTMLGEVTTARLTATRDTRPGDAVLVVGPVGLLGTGLLAKNCASHLQAAGMSVEQIGQARSLLRSPGISIVRAARLAAMQGSPHSMHDTTHGGLVNALVDLARVAGVTLEVEASRVPVHDLTRQVAAALGLDPWGMMGSGSFVLTCSEDDVPPLLAAYQKAGITAARVGRAMAGKAEAIRLDGEGGSRHLSTLEEDPVLGFMQQRGAKPRGPESGEDPPRT